jgi:hypothetical protein
MTTTTRPSAATQVALYRESIRDLRSAATRSDRADVLRRMAGEAAGVAAAVKNAPGKPDTVADPLAWTDLSAWLTVLAAAEEGRPTAVTGDDGEPVTVPGTAELASAATQDEHAAAVAAVIAVMKTSVGSAAIARYAAAGSERRDVLAAAADTDPEHATVIRRFAAGQAEEIANIITGSYAESVETLSTALL